MTELLPSARESAERFPSVRRSVGTKDTKTGVFVLESKGKRGVLDVDSKQASVYLDDEQI